MLVAFASESVRSQEREEVFYGALSAYIAGESGDFEAAARGLVRIGSITRDPEMMRDAAEFALRANSLDLALTAGRVWVDIQNTVEANTLVANVLISRGDYRDAAGQLWKMVDRLGIPPEHYQQMISRITDPGEFSDAVDQMNELYAHLGSDGRYNLLVARLYDGVGRQAEAAAAARTAAQQLPEDRDAGLLYARLSLATDHSEVGAHLTRLAQAGRLSAGDFYRALAHVDASDLALESLELMRTVYSDSRASANELYHLARMALFANRREAARDYAQRAAAEDPSDLQANFLLAFMQMRNGKPDGLVDGFRRIAEMRGSTIEEIAMDFSFYVSSLTEEASSPNTTIPLEVLTSYRAGIVFRDLGETGLALRTLSEVQDEDGYLHFYAQSEMAQMFMKDGEAGKARAILVNLHNVYGSKDRRHQNGRDMLVELALTETELVQIEKGEQAAFDHLKRQSKMFGETRSLLYKLAILAENLGNIDFAENALRRYIAVGTASQEGRSDPDGYNALGYMLADRNRKLDEAQRLIEQAARERPTDPNIIDSLGWVQFRRGDYELARSNLVRAASWSMAAEIHAHLGEVFWVLGERSKAQVIWERARYLHPENEVLLETIERLETL